MRETDPTFDDPEGFVDLAAGDPMKRIATNSFPTTSWSTRWPMTRSAAAPGANTPSGLIGYLFFPLLKIVGDLAGLPSARRRHVAPETAQMGTCDRGGDVKCRFHPVGLD
ncbi:hypothetical protein ACWGTI_31475 [Mesorhizobium sp. ArgA1]